MALCKLKCAKIFAKLVKHYRLLALLAETLIIGFWILQLVLVN